MIFGKLVHCLLGSSCPTRAHLPYSNSPYYRRSQAVMLGSTDSSRSWIKDELVDDHESRFYANAAGLLKKKQRGMEESDKCAACFLTKTLCICGQVTALFKVTAPVKARVCVFMHYKEFGRASNTGKILVTGMPQAQLYIFGVKEQQEKLADLLTSTPSVILHPSGSAVAVSQFRDWYETHDCPTLCVIDSTWPQSLPMVASLPASIPRIRVDDWVMGASQFLNRKQMADKGKVSTVEAVALALQALGEQPATLEPIYQSLQLGVDAVLQQGGKRPAYGHNFVSQIAAEVSSKGPYTARQIERPQSCPHCAASHETVLFKNMGLRWLSRGRALRGELLNSKEAAEAVAAATAAAAEVDVDVEAAVGADRVERAQRVEGAVGVEGASAAGEAAAIAVVARSRERGVQRKEAKSAVGDGAEAEAAEAEAEDTLHRVWRCSNCSDFFAIEQPIEQPVLDV
jgi:DTW domain-containing protein YfiP